MAVRLVPIVFCTLILPALCAFAQAAPNDSEQPVRVNVTVNPDGTRTAYQFDPAHRQATATTTTPDGKVTGKIKYEIDDAGRFSSGLVYGADDKFLFKSVYKYTGDGRLDQETHLAKDDAVINKMVYSYDANGKPSGYVVYDAAGKVVGRTTPMLTKPTQTPKPGKKK
jgi:hypothetical protein